MEILRAYAVTFGWAMVGAVSMGVAIAISLFLFDICTPQVKHWDLVKQGNIPMGIIIASVIIAVGIVVFAAIHP